MRGIYVAVKCYARNSKAETIWYCKPKDHYSIYDKMMKLTGNDHEISADAASWCEMATVGEIYEFREGEITIVDIK